MPESASPAPSGPSSPSENAPSENAPSESADRSAADTLRALIGAVATREQFDLDALYAKDAVVSHAFGVGPSIRWEGIEQLRTHFASSPAGVMELSVRDLAVYSTQDPEVAIAEWIYDGRNTVNGRTFSVPNVIVARVRDGRLVETRDYHHHAVLAALFDRLPEYTKQVEEVVV